LRAGRPFPFAFVLVQEHPGAEEGKHSDRHVVGGATDERPECVSEQQADDRHRHLEAGHQDADAQL
jgi:hypothetical protein